MRAPLAGRGLLGGAPSLGAYGIVLWAMTRAPVAAVAALRETSVLFAALIGVCAAEGRLRPAARRRRRRAATRASAGVADQELYGSALPSRMRSQRRHRRRRHRRRSTAYHLAKLGVTRRRAARAGQAHLRHDLARRRPGRPDARRTATMTRMSQYGIELYSTLEARDRARDRLEAMRQRQRRRARPSAGWCRSARLALARSFGVECRGDHAARGAGAIAPLLRTDDLQGALWIPGRRQGQPGRPDASRSPRARAMRGVKIVEGVEVTGVR